MRKQGIQSKLIQSMEGFRFSNLAEVKYILKYITNRVNTPLIPDDIWEEAKRTTFEKYDGSQSIPYLKQCIKQFEQINRVKYRTDLWEFVFESNVEDFCDITNAEVVVSTIHKAKGREFDDVYMLITEPLHLTDDVLRRYYVGMTRAKQRLFIHTSSSIFDRLPVDQRRVDQYAYDMPDEMVLQLTHKDVNLGFFKTRKKEVLALRAGEQLHFDNNYLYSLTTNLPVVQLSQKMQADLLSWEEKGYMVSSSTIRFIVAWRPKDAPKEEKEHAVLLLDLCLTKK